ncbi:hypothetical protein N5C36_21550 [Shewanella xiamenensis]|uniref:hypothetical protein n=1 Tax=Shewanella xiamenensis TaxID=332186 RepID=UPI00244A0421|nr:hypothetical protein [Shewanella xiamenensis]MDH1316658.1 hypothetical protein [Shewanella xiamenensis]
MEVTVFYVGYGDMEGQLWANAQMLTDYSDKEGGAGCQVGKIDVDTDHNNALGKRLVGELQRAKAPIKISLVTGAKAKAGKVVTVIKDYKLVEEKITSSPLNKPLGA